MMQAKAESESINILVTILSNGVTDASGTALYEVRLINVDNIANEWTVQKSFKQFTEFNQNLSNLHTLVHKFPSGHFLGVNWSSNKFNLPENKITDLQAWFREIVGLLMSPSSTRINSTTVEHIKAFIQYDELYSMSTPADALTEGVVNTVVDLAVEHRNEIIEQQVQNFIPEVSPLSLLKAVCLGAQDVLHQPYVQPIATLALKFYGIYLKDKDNLELFEKLKDKIDNVLAQLTHSAHIYKLDVTYLSIMLPSLFELEKVVSSTNETMKCFKDNDKWYVIVNGVKRCILTTDFNEKIKSCIDEIESALAAYHNNFNLLINYCQLSKLPEENNNSTKVLLNTALSPANFADNIFNLCGKYCPGTSLWALNIITDWLNTDYNLPPAKHIFVLLADQGVGKSILCSQLVRTLCSDENTKVVGALFFQHNDPFLSDVKSAIKSLAYQIALQVPMYADALVAIVNNSFMLQCLNTAVELFNYLIKIPLEAIIDVSIPKNGLLIILDAIDEAGGYHNFYSDREDILNLISYHLITLPAWVRILVTSRRDHDIVNYLNIFDPLIILHTDKNHREDVEMYIEHNLSEIVSDVSIVSEGVKILSEKCDGDFYYFSNAFDDATSQLRTTDSNELLNVIKELPTGTYGRYDELFRRINHTKCALFAVYSERGKEISEDLAHLYFHILQIIVCAEQQFTLIELENLLCYQSDITRSELYDVAALFNCIFPLIPCKFENQDTFEVSRGYDSVYEWLSLETGKSADVPHIDRKLAHLFISSKLLVEVDAMLNELFTTPTVIAAKYDYCFNHIISHLIYSEDLIMLQHACRCMTNIYFLVAIYSNAGYNVLVKKLDKVIDALEKVTVAVVSLDKLRALHTCLQLSANNLKEKDDTSVLQLPFYIIEGLRKIAPEDPIIHEFIVECELFIKIWDPSLKDSYNRKAIEDFEHAIKLPTLTAEDPLKIVMPSMNWYKPLVFNSHYDGCIIEPVQSSRETADANAEFHSLRTAVMSSQFDVDVYHSLLFDPANNMMPTMYISLLNDEQLEELKDYIQLQNGNSSFQIVIDCQTRESFMFNDEMESLTDDIWDSMDIRSTLKVSFTDIVSSLGSITGGDMVMIGPDYDYEKNEWNSVPSLWIMYKQPFARHYAHSADAVYHLKHQNMNLHHFFFTHHELLAWESTCTDDRNMWKDSCGGFYNFFMKTIQPGMAFYVRIPNRPTAKRYGTVGFSVNTLKIVDPSRSYFTTAAHIFDYVSSKTNERVIIPEGTDIMIGNDCIVGTYCGMDDEKVVAMLKFYPNLFTKMNYFVKVDPASLQSPVVSDVWGIERQQIPNSILWDNNPHNFLNKSGGSTAVTKGIACSLGEDLIHPRLANEDDVPHHSSYLVVRRPRNEVSDEFAATGDSGGPVFITSSRDNNRTIIVLGFIEARFRAKTQYVLVQPFDREALEVLFYASYMARYCNGLEKTLLESRPDYQVRRRNLLETQNLSSTSGFEFLGSEKSQATITRDNPVVDNSVLQNPVIPEATRTIRWPLLIVPAICITFGLYCFEGQTQLSLKKFTDHLLFTMNKLVPTTKLLPWRIFFRK